MIYVFTMWMEESFACIYDNNFKVASYSSPFFIFTLLHSLFKVRRLEQIVKGEHWNWKHHHHRHWPQTCLRLFSLFTQSNCLRTVFWKDAIDSTCRQYFLNRSTICWAIKQKNHGIDLTISSQGNRSGMETSFNVIQSETHADYAVYYLQPPPPTQSVIIPKKLLYFFKPFG